MTPRSPHGLQCASPRSPEDRSGRPAAPSLPDGQVAQLVEQRTENPRVDGSIPSLATIFLRSNGILPTAQNALSGAAEVGKACGKPWSPAAPDFSVRICATGCCANGHDVLCVDNFFTGTKQNIAHLMGNPYFELMRHDVTFPLYVEVDHIYNLACPASPVHYQFDPVQTTKTSVHGAINMLGLAKRTKARIMQASTSEVYGDPEVHPQTEEYWGRVNPIGIRFLLRRRQALRRDAVLRLPPPARRATSRSCASSIPTARACIRTTAAW